MANTPNVPKSNKISTNFVPGIIGWAIIATAVIAGAGFYLGVQYQSRQESARRLPCKTLNAAQAQSAVAT